MILKFKNGVTIEVTRVGKYEISENFSFEITKTEIIAKEILINPQISNVKNAENVLVSHFPKHELWDRIGFMLNKQYKSHSCAVRKSHKHIEIIAESSIPLWKLKDYLNELKDIYIVDILYSWCRPIVENNNKLIWQNHILIECKNLEVNINNFSDYIDYRFFNDE